MVLDILVSFTTDKTATKPFVCNNLFNNLTDFENLRPSAFN